MQTQQIVESVQRSAEARADNRANNLTSMPEGYHWWQGDVSIQRLATVPEGLVPSTPHTEDGTIQLAPGNSLGSQHRVAAAQVTYYHRAGDVLTGPVLLTGPHGATITHPKHGHCVLPPNTAYAIDYQQAFSPLNELRRQED